MTTNPPLLLVVWHSRTGAARQMADAVVRGAHAVATEFAHDQPAMAESCLLNVCQRSADTVDSSLLLRAAGYVFCTPENLGSMTGTMKEFFDRNYYAVLDSVAGRPYGAIIAAGTDGHGARQQLERIVTGWRLRAVAPTVVIRNGAQTPEEILAPKTIPATDLERCAELGGLVAATLLLA